MNDHIASSRIFTIWPGTCQKRDGRVVSLDIIVRLLIVLFFPACDPIWDISASKPIPAPLERTCVIETLRMQNTVQEAGIGATGLTYAILTIPPPLKTPESNPAVGVDEHRNDKGVLELKLEMVWVGSKGSPEYRAYVQTVVEELRDQIIEKCSRG